MPSNSYITSGDYATITGGDQDDATAPRMKRASMLLDARCGLTLRASSEDDLLLLDLDNLNARQREAARQWVAWFVYSLAENGDSIQAEETIRLGRFQATARENRNEIVPDEMMYADQMLKSSGLIRRDIRSNRNQVNVQRSLDVIAID